MNADAANSEHAQISGPYLIYSCDHFPFPDSRTIVTSHRRASHHVSSTCTVFAR